MNTKKSIKLKPHSVAPIKLPTEFAELNPDLTVYEKPYIDCSGCENVGAPDSVIKLLSKAIVNHPELVWDHWNPQDRNLRKKIAKLHNVDVKQVFITSGAIAGIDYSFNIFTKKGNKTGLMRPDWPGFEHYVDFYKNKKYFLDNFEFPFFITTKQISEFVKKNKLDFFVFANPVPVQGHLIGKNDIEKLLKDNPSTLFLIDEADTVSPNKQAASLTTKYDNVIFLGSFSKFYGLSGLRIGYLITPLAYSKHFKNTINVIEVGGLAILAANITIDDKTFQKHTQENIKESIRVIKEACKNTSYQIIASPDCLAAYIYSEKSNPKTDFWKYGIKILKGQYFGLPKHINGGRFNLAVTKNAKLLAQKIKEISK
jgi:histidinol-phosphate/aromatic aminotransferase/cobyric acid decarboxylase-like protein